MIVWPLFPLLFLFLRTIPAATAAGLNDSFIIHSSSSSTSTAPSFESDPGNPHALLKDVLKAIAVEQKWDWRRIRVSRLEKPRFLRSHKYEFRVRVGKGDLLVRFHEKLDGWRRFLEEGDLEDLVDGVSSKTVVGPIQLEGPFELLAGDEDRLHLQLPLNSSVSGLKRILVREGITVEIIGAQVVSLLHSVSSDLSNRSFPDSRDKIPFWPLQHRICTPLIPVHISGLASIDAYVSRNPSYAIKANVLSKTMIELKTDISYPKNTDKRNSSPFGSLWSRISILEKLLRWLSLDRTSQGSLGFVETKINAATMVRFQLELEVDATTAHALGKSSPPEWRTRPDVKRAWFDVVAVVEAGRLHPMVVKRVRTFTAVDSVAWSNLLSNISFTKLRNVLVPPRMLTLDVKWYSRWHGVTQF